MKQKFGALKKKLKPVVKKLEPVQEVVAKLLAKLPKKKPHSEKYYKRIAFFNKYSLVFHFVLACALTFMIEVISRHNIASALNFMSEHTLAYLYNAFIIFASLSLVYLFRLRAQIRLLISGFWLFLGTINGCVLSNRVTPFGYTDLKCIPDLFAMQNTSYFTKEEATAVVCVVAAFVTFLVLFFVKGPRYEGKRHKVFGPVWIATLLLVGLPITTQAAQNSNIIATYFANIAQGYADYGFVYGFSSSVVGVGMDEPEDYSKETIEAIETLVASASEETTVTAENAPNIICVLLESFCDPEEIGFLELSKDAVPTFHFLEENFSTGYLTVPVVGAGTANTEFEILTGMNMQYFGTGEYPYKTILKQTDCESIASNLSKLGYGTHVVHNNTATFYSRNNAFSMMGFDTFTSKELMNITELTPLGSWATDDVLVDETIKALDYTEDQADFIYTITVGAHGDYPTEKVIENPEITVSGTADEATNNQWEYYINMLHNVDRFISDLINEVNKRDEDTIIVMFGDHLPTMGLTDADMKSGDIFKTNYITWNNMNLPKEDADITAYQLLAQITNQVGIHEGTILNYSQTQADSATYQSGLENLQYDLLYGERYAYNGEDLYPATDIMMDVEDVSVTSLYKNKITDKLTVHGSNFTKNTKIFVNGEKVSTTYLSSTIITTPLKNIQDGDVITVSITGSKGIILREGVGEVVYEDPDVVDTETETSTETTESSTAAAEENTQTTENSSENADSENSLDDAANTDSENNLDDAANAGSENSLDSNADTNSESTASENSNSAVNAD